MARPLRVIDVEKTISSSGSGGIHFARSPTWHVISHTWSADVRAFSCAIGERLLADLEKRQSYEALFESAGLQSHAAYQALVEFLDILQTEGVRWVWFDAVCINQMDTEEKDHEIQHMGTYYQKAVGCYVVQHGIGKGFELLHEFDGVKDGSAAQTPQLPRWFTRAWTLQEWVLPPMVTFILDLASDPHLCMVAFLVLVQAEPASCMCCKYAITLSPIFLHECLLLSQANGQDKETNSLSSAITRLQRCSKASNDPHFRNVPGRRHWYFADDLGYSFLLRLKFILDQMPSTISFKDLRAIVMRGAGFELTNRIGAKQSILDGRSENEVGYYCLPRVVREISIRDSSNPEDRVLSVLKLLGVQNAVQVRTGKSLQAQLCQFAKSLLDSKNLIQGQELLIRMCIVDGFGNETPGMSWMPQFEVQKGTWQEGARYLAPSMFTMETDSPIKEFAIATRCVAVSDTGMLHIEADVGNGKLVLVPSHPFPKRQNDHQRADELFKPMVLEVEGQVISYVYVYMYPDLPQSTTCIVARDSDTNFQSGMRGEVCIAFQSPGLQYLRDRITVFLVKIAAGFSYITSSPAAYCLVCVQEAHGSPFHKIGYLVIAENQFPSSQKMLCCIGGLGHDLNKLLFNPVESVNCF